MEAFVARQPIFDRRQQVLGYELLFRSDLRQFDHSGDSDEAAAGVLNHTFFTLGLQAVTRGKRAFVRLTQNLLLQELVTAFPKEAVGVQLLEPLPPSANVMDAARTLKQQGYPLVFGDFVLETGFNPFLEVADFIKVDFLRTAAERWGEVATRLSARGVQLIADRLQTREAYQEAASLGFRYFQGSFFRVPEVAAVRDIPANKVQCMQLLHEINRPNLELRQLEEIVKRDVSLSYRLLRLVNSAFFGLSNEVRTIRTALSLLGLREARKWLTMIALSGIGAEGCEQLLVDSLFRARFCEILAPKLGLEKRASEMFLLGLLSLIDVIMETPMAALLERIAIAEDLKQTLLGRPTPLRPPLDLIRAYDDGNWEIFGAIERNYGLQEAGLASLILDAMEWSGQVFAR